MTTKSSPGGDGATAPDSGAQAPGRPDHRMARRRYWSPVARRRTLSLLFFVLVFGGWEALAVLGIVNPQLLVPPSVIAATFWEDWSSGQLWPHLRASGTQFVAGYVIGAVLGVALGVLMGASRRLEVALNPYILGMYATPTQAWLPLLIILLGIGLAPKIVLVALFTMFIVVLNTASAVKGVDPALVKVGRSFGASRWAMFRKVVLPAASPLIVAGLRLGVGRAVIGVFLSEWVGATAGVGFYILRSGTQFRVDRVFVGVLILIVFTVVLTELIRMAEDRFTPWRQRTQL